MLHIRPALPADCGVILQFIRELADYEKLADQVVATEQDIRSSLFGGLPHARALIAESNGTPVGFCLYFYNFSTFLGRYGIYVEDLYVQSAQRGMGIGGALLRRVAEIAIAEKCGRVEWSVLDWNQPAIDVYRRMGAVPMEGWTMYRLTGDALQAFAKEAA